MKHICTVAVLTFLPFVFASAARAQAPKISDAPQSIRELSSVIQGKRPDDARAEIIKRLGKPHRDVGSGVRIEQWDLPEGVLTFHPGTGPAFADAKAGKIIRLVQTSNPAGSNILTGYEMTTTPDPKNHGTRFWLGNLEFGRGASYRFTDSGQHSGKRDGQAGNFFMLHPAGTVEIRYDAPVTADTLLETLAGGTVVAHLIFTSADRAGRATFSIRSSERDRTLAFGADTPLPFAMNAGWKNHWR